MAETPSSKSSNEEFTSPGQSFATVDDSSTDNAAASFGEDFADEGGHGEHTEEVTQVDAHPGRLISAELLPASDSDDLPV